MAKKSDKSDTHKKRLLAALEKTRGIVSPACEMADLSRDTFYRYLKEDPDFEAKWMEIRDIHLDLAEAKVLNSIDQNDDIESAKFLLRYRGGHRGYVVHGKQEITGSGGKALDINIEVVNGSDKPKD